MNKTPLNGWHLAHNGRMVDFAGWEMPVHYSSIVQEHHSVRNSAGLFDISHMGRLQFRGSSCSEFLNNVLTNDTSKLNLGDVRYSLICNDDGGILDDVLVYRFEDRWELVVNASNREKIVAWLQQSPGFSAIQFTDRTALTGMIALQGPLAIDIFRQAASIDASVLKYYSARDIMLFGASATVSRTGYTGEDGIELILPSAATKHVWSQLLEAGSGRGLLPAGLGSRDTLRLEAGMPLYGHELSESTDPLAAGLSFAVKFSKTKFTGKAALQRIKNSGIRKSRVGLILEGRRIARENSPILVAGQNIGQITSGTFSPTLQKVIAMAFINVASSGVGTDMEVDLRGTLVRAKTVPLPFYKRSK